MKLYVCPKCGMPAFGNTDKNDFSDTITCLKCGHSDYSFTFERINTVAPSPSSIGTFDISLFKNLPNICDSIVNGQIVTNILSDFSSRYKLGTETLVEIFNAYLKSETRQIYNPTYFVAVDEDNLPELELEKMEQSDIPAFEENIRIEQNELKWREQYEKSQTALAALEARYNQLLDKFQQQKKELQQLKDLYE